MIKRFSLKAVIAGAIFTAASLFTGCYSVFTGGTGGQIVDSESTSTPKAGIGFVDVYAYTSLAERDVDFALWKDDTVFAPTASYYGHTTSAADGTFSINRLVWKSNNPAFGRDADISQIYFLYYHEKYGLTKGQTLIVSDSTSNTVYQELTSVKKTTDLTLSFKDAATDSLTDVNLFVSVSVPQATAKNTEAVAKVYETNITGTGTVQITYPRWASDEDKKAGKENTPAVIVKYYQSSGDVTWKACYNQDNSDKNYAFRADALTGIPVKVSNNRYSVSFYGKSTKLQMSVINGQCITGAAPGDSSDDGKIVSMSAKDSDGNYTIDCGQVSTQAQSIGTTGTEKHGVFTGLGDGITWTDTEYTGKYATKDVRISVEGDPKKDMTVRSNVPSYNVQL